MEERLFDDKELATFLHVSLHWVKHKVDEGVLVPKKVGNKRLYVCSEIMRKLDAGDFAAKNNTPAEERVLRLMKKVQ